MHVHAVEALVGHGHSFVEVQNKAEPEPTGMSEKLTCIQQLCFLMQLHVLKEAVHRSTTLHERELGRQLLAMKVVQFENSREPFNTHVRLHLKSSLAGRCDRYTRGIDHAAHNLNQVYIYLLRPRIFCW